MSDIKKEITEKLVTALEGNILPWRRPWSISKNAGRPANAVSGRSYGGVNTLLTQLHQFEHGLQSRWFGTFAQWQAMGGMVKKRPAHVEPGKWGCKVVFYKPVEKKTQEDDEEKTTKFMVMRMYTVFSADQVEGEAIERFQVIEESGNVVPDFQPADELIAATNAVINHGGNEAFYRRPEPFDSWPCHDQGDFIQMPHRSRFDPIGAYYETILHELAHWAEIRTSFDHREAGYAMGELVAELASCFLSAELGVPNGEELENHAGYLKSWLTAMKADSSFIFKASSQASKVTDFLLSHVRTEEPVIETAQD